MNKKFSIIFIISLFLIIVVIVMLANVPQPTILLNDYPIATPWPTFENNGNIISNISIKVSKDKLDYENVWPQCLLSAYGEDYAVLTNDGTVWAWSSRITREETDIEIEDGFMELISHNPHSTPTAVTGLENIVSITYCMAVKEDGTIYSWKKESGAILVKQISGIDNALHIFNINYNQYLVLLKDRSLLYVDNSKIKPLKSVANVLDYNDQYLITQDGCIYYLDLDSDESCLVYKPETTNKKAIVLGEWNDGVVFQTLDGKSYNIPLQLVWNNGIENEDIKIKEICNDIGMRLCSYTKEPSYLIRYDGKILMQNGNLIEPNINDAIYLDGEAILTVNGEIYQLLSRYYYCNEEGGYFLQESNADRIIISIDSDNINLQYYIDHYNYKVDTSYIGDNSGDFSIFQLLYMGQ